MAKGASMENLFSILLSICIGIGLSAACGFRVFMPLLIMSIAALAGHLTLSPAFAWIGTYSALTAFAVAACLEILGYYIPWVDNLLDAIATPAAIIAGTIATASSVSGMSPLLTWTLAVIAGGGTAGTIQGFTILSRATSSLTTGGLANSLVATVEAGSSITRSTLAIAVPVLAAVVVCFLLYLAAKKIFKQLRKG